MKKLLLLAVVAMMLASVANAQAPAAPVKYQGEIDFGYSIGVGKIPHSRINIIHTIQGVQVGKYVSAGLGLGLDLYHQVDEQQVVVPIYLNLKLFPVSGEVIPYFSFDIGVGIGASEYVSGLSGMYCTPAIGIKAGNFKAQLGYNTQRVSEFGVGVNLNAVQFKIGMAF